MITAILIALGFICARFVNGRLDSTEVMHTTSRDGAHVEPADQYEIPRESIHARILQELSIARTSSPWHREIPDLIDMLEDPSAANQASYQLCSMGDEVIPALLIAITNADQQARLRTVVNLGARAVDEAGVIDALLERLAADPDATVRSASAHALGRFPDLPHEAMEALVAALDDPVSSVASDAALALGKGFGPRARSAVPALLDHWRRTGYSTSEALTLVDPKTAKRVGATHPPNPYE